MKKFILIILLLTANCAAKHDEILRRTVAIARQNQMVVKIYPTQDFNIFTLQKISNPTAPLRIYIEGDGRAYVNKYTPSLDPTPVSYFLIELISQDKAPNIIYIARPCQFAGSAKCREEFWTSERFSSAAVAAISQVIDEFPEYKLELVGYSGGAAIINHLSQKNIKNIRSLAGNLDLESFAKHHKISPLDEAAVDYARLAKIPQIHFIGAKDKVIPLEIFDAYQKKLPQKNCVKLKVVEGATHNAGWKEKWQELLAAEVGCV